MEINKINLKLRNFKQVLLWIRKFYYFQSCSLLKCFFLSYYLLAKINEHNHCLWIIFKIFSSKAWTFNFFNCYNNYLSKNCQVYKNLILRHLGIKSLSLSFIYSSFFFFFRLNATNNKSGASSSALYLLIKQILYRLINVRVSTSNVHNSKIQFNCHLMQNIDFSDYYEQLFM